MYLHAMPVTISGKEDIPPLVKLLNNAYRGEESKKGWTTEADIVAGDLRTNEENLKELMELPGAVFLKFTNDKNESDSNRIEGCVFLHIRQGKLYLGMLSVSPGLQAKGIGKQIMAAAELYAKEQGCPAVFMRVISIRHALISWYERQGYYKTGEIQPFDDTKFGTAKEAIEFIVLQKIV
jgi:ribosomal protein S18 acetylase RimI-like enzyme